MFWLTSTTNKILVSHEHETGAEMASTPKDYTFSLMIFFQIERKENREKCKSFQLQSLSLCFSYERKGRERGRNRRSRKKRYIRFFIFCFFGRNRTLAIDDQARYRIPSTPKHKPDQGKRKKIMLGLACLGVTSLSLSISSGNKKGKRSGENLGSLWTDSLGSVFITVGRMFFFLVD
jgi:hypothetical protein